MFSIIDQYPVVETICKYLKTSSIPLLLTCKKGSEYLDGYYIKTFVTDSPWETALITQDCDWLYHLKLQNQDEFLDDVCFCIEKGLDESLKWLLDNDYFEINCNHINFAFWKDSPLKVFLFCKIKLHLMLDQ